MKKAAVEVGSITLLYTVGCLLAGAVIALTLFGGGDERQEPPHCEWRPIGDWAVSGIVDGDPETATFTSSAGVWCDDVKVEVEPLEAS